MILVIDIGNSAARIGVFNHADLLQVDQLLYGEVDIAQYVQAWLQQQNVEEQIEAISLCSVVPKQTALLTAALKKQLNVLPRVLGQDLDAGLINQYRDPSAVGGDRLANARAAWERFQTDVIIIDYGTALTVDLVTAKREYVGGAIAPGLRMALKSLADNTALLPEIELAPPTELLGTDTRSSLLSGVIRGSAELVKGLIQAIREKYPNARVILTGGEAEFVVPWLPEVDDVDPNLTLKGLAAATNCKPHLSQIVK